MNTFIAHISVLSNAHGAWPMFWPVLRRCHILRWDWSVLPLAHHSIFPFENFGLIRRMWESPAPSKLVAVKGNGPFNRECVVECQKHSGKRRIAFIGRWLLGQIRLYKQFGWDSASERSCSPAGTYKIFFKFGICIAPAHPSWAPLCAESRVLPR
jgi:hypothetical protein